MHEFEYLLVCIISLLFGFIGSLTSSYVKEKGKNIATKEDIANITTQIESVRSEFSKKHLKTQYFFEKRMDAYAELSHMLHVFKSLFYTGRDDHYDFCYQLLCDKDAQVLPPYFCLARQTVLYNEQYNIYFSQNIDTLTKDLVGLCLNYEKTYKEALSNDTKEIDVALDLVKQQINQIRNELKKEISDE